MCVSASNRKNNIQLNGALNIKPSKVKQWVLFQKFITRNVGQYWRFSAKLIRKLTWAWNLVVKKTPISLNICWILETESSIYSLEKETNVSLGPSKHLYSYRNSRRRWNADPVKILTVFNHYLSMKSLHFLKKD